MSTTNCLLCLDEVRLVRDHDHDTGFFRGHICHACNALMGQLDSGFLGEKIVHLEEELSKLKAWKDRAVAMCEKAKREGVPFRASTEIVAVSLRLDQNLYDALKRQARSEENGSMNRIVTRVLRLSLEAQAVKEGAQ